MHVSAWADEGGRACVCVCVYLGERRGFHPSNACRLDNICALRPKRGDCLMQMRPRWAVTRRPACGSCDKRGRSRR